RPRPETAAGQIARAAERVDDLAVLEVSSHRVDREVAPVEVVLDARRRVDDDLEVVAARPGRALAPRRRELDPGGDADAHVAVSWGEGHGGRLGRGRGNLHSTRGGAGTAGRLPRHLRARA